MRASWGEGYDTKWMGLPLSLALHTVRSFGELPDVTLLNSYEIFHQQSALHVYDVGMSMSNSTHLPL